MIIIRVICVGFIHTEGREELIELDKEGDGNRDHIREYSRMMMSLLEGEEEVCWVVHVGC